MLAFRLILLVVVLVTLSACIQLQPTSPASRYFILEPKVAIAPINLQNSLSVTIELVEFPSYLRRPQIVTKQDTNIVRMSESNRWATPLEENIVFVIRTNLEMMIADATVTVAPWQASRNHDRRLQLSVVKFSGTFGRHSEVDIRWRLMTADRETGSGTFVYQQAIDDSHEGLIRVLNQALDELSRELTAALVKSGT